MQVIDFDSRERDLSVHLLPVCALVQVLGIRILYQSPWEITCNTEVAWIIGTLVNFNIVCRRMCGREWLFVSLRDPQRTGDLSTLRLRLQPGRGSSSPRKPECVSWETLDVQGGKHWCENCGDFEKSLKWRSWNYLCYVSLSFTWKKWHLCLWVLWVS